MRGCGVWGWVDNACLLMIYISGIGVHVCSFMYFEKCFELTIFSFNIWTLFYIYAGLSWPWSYMVVGFTSSYSISAYHHWCCEFESHSGQGVQHYVIKVCPWLATGRWFSPGPPVSSTNKTDCHDIS